MASESVVVIQLVEIVMVFLSVVSQNNATRGSLCARYMHTVYFRLLPFYGPTQIQLVRVFEMHRIVRVRATLL